MSDIVISYINIMPGVKYWQVLTSIDIICIMENILSRVFKCCDRLDMLS